MSGTTSVLLRNYSDDFSYFTDDPESIPMHRLHLKCDTLQSGKQQT